MNKKLENQLREFTEAVNAFHSEHVQIKVIEWLLKQLEHKIALETRERINNKSDYVEMLENSPDKSGKQPGPTVILNQLIKTDYFNEPRTVAEITEFCTAYAGKQYYTYTLSSVLLGFIQRGKLKRYKNENDSYYLYEIAT